MRKTSDILGGAIVIKDFEIRKQFLIVSQVMLEVHFEV